MSVSIHNIDVLEIDDIVRHIDFPAMQTGPLYRCMFPSTKEITGAQRDEIIRWYSEGLRDALRRQTDRFIQVCTPEGTPLGFCGWTIGSLQRSDDVGRPTSRDAQSPLPELLDLSAWLSLSRDLKKERDRILDQLDTFCRKLGLRFIVLLTHMIASGLTFMSVRPDSQRQGFGSQLLEAVCHEVDKHGLPAFVMASPAGIRLYKKFGFEAVGKLETQTGTITSMFRPGATA